MRGDWGGRERADPHRAASNDNGGAEARINICVMTLARLFGRQIAREEFRRLEAANDNAPAGEAGPASSERHGEGDTAARALKAGAVDYIVKPFSLAELALRRQPQQLTHDLGTSRLAQATAAHSALVEVERLDGPAPEVEVHAPPAVAEG